MKSTTLTPLFILAAALPLSAVTVDFEDLTVPEGGYYAGEDSAGSFTSDGVTFTTNYTYYEDYGYGSWDGIAYSNLGWLYSSTSDYTLQYYLAASSEDEATTLNAASDTYAVIYDPGAYGTSPSITLPDGLSAPVSMDVTNTIYTWASIAYGDSYASAFGEGSSFTLTVTGYDSEGTETGETTAYLADYTSDSSEDWYELGDGFTTVDLTALGEDVKTITFTLDSSDSGTPSYFAMDNLTVYGSYLWPVTNDWDSNWYGTVFAFQNDEGWIYSWENCCYQYMVGDSTGVWGYDPVFGWFWTSDESYPYIYIYDVDCWAYFYENSATSENDRLYYIWDDSNASVSNFPYAYASELVPSVY